MKSYDLDTLFTFGKYEGKTLKEIIEQEPDYLDWCVINLDHFYLSDDMVEEITKINKNFKLSDIALEKLKEKYQNFESDHYERDNGWQSYDDWLEGEYGDDAETAYWNTD